ncbi:MAG TPA: HEAT repeat domain-containing protein [Verrucomicrobiae bacterium]|jgi:HEAT repeat protein|nr:HEAT repeat domain-containing protein [Verrucomicrobiae bacterium]
MAELCAPVFDISPRATALWGIMRGVVLLSLLLVSGCSRSARQNQQPTYGGKPLIDWAMMTQDQGIGGAPSAAAGRAADAVRAIGPTQAIPFLVRWIQPPWTNSMVAGGAVQCFRIFGPEAKAAILGLAKILNLRATTMYDRSAQMMAAESLSYLGPEAVHVLLEAATRFQGQDIQREIIEDIGNFGTNGAEAKPAILKWSKNPDESVRMGALHAYVGIETNRAAVVPYLLTALKDHNDLVRRDAAEALGFAAAHDKGALPALLKALADPEWQARLGAVQGLGELGVAPEVVLPLLTQKLHDENSVIRRSAAFSLGAVGGKEAFNALMASTDDPNGFVREAVFQSLRRIDAKELERSGKRFH